MAIAEDSLSSRASRTTEKRAQVGPTSKCRGRGRDVSLPTIYIPLQLPSSPRLFALRCPGGTIDLQMYNDAYKDEDISAQQSLG